MSWTAEDAGAFFEKVDEVEDALAEMEEAQEKRVDMLGDMGDSLEIMSKKASGLFPPGIDVACQTAAVRVFSDVGGSLEDADDEDSDGSTGSTQRGDGDEVPIEPIRVVKLLGAFSRAEYLAAKFRLEKIKCSPISERKAVSIIESVYAAKSMLVAAASRKMPLESSC